MIRFDHTNLCPEIPTDKRFNASIIETVNGEHLISFRDNWKHSRIWGAWLDRDFKPTGRFAKIDLPDMPAARAFEDPRWFRVNGQLFLCYCGFSGKTATAILYAKVNESTLAVEQVIWPQWAGARRREKNWQPFDYNGEVHFVYSINPHVILKPLEPNEDGDTWMEWVANTPFKGTWSGGYMRGGATSVERNGEMYSFFHGSIDREPPHRRRQYNCGVYTFSPKPPFEILRYTPEPIAWADPAVTPDDVEVDVIFPAGAVFKDGKWVVSYGVCDKWIELRSYSEQEIEEKLHAH